MRLSFFQVGALNRQPDTVTKQTRGLPSCPCTTGPHALNRLCESLGKGRAPHVLLPRLKLLNLQDALALLGSGRLLPCALSSFALLFPMPALITLLQTCKSSARMRQTTSTRGSCWPALTEISSASGLARCGCWPPLPLLLSAASLSAARCCLSCRCGHASVC
jgi:hypothetical protein